MVMEVSVVPESQMMQSFNDGENQYGAGSSAIASAAAVDASMHRPLRTDGPQVPMATIRPMMGAVGATAGLTSSLPAPAADLPATYHGLGSHLAPTQHATMKPQAAGASPATSSARPRTG
ncbi:hypothetical protein THAOC_13647, partial [Thalassiosira oceanica]